MITPSSNKSSFGTYFKFRLRSRLKYLIVSSVLNILMLPLFSINLLILLNSSSWNGNLFELQYFTFTSELHIISAVAVLFMTLFSGVKVFDYCVKSERTDTYGGLPVTIRGKFFADLLSGYISHVAPIIPCAVFAMIMSVPIQGAFDKFSSSLPAEVLNGSVIRLFAELSAALFLSYTFAYLLSVLVTVCCGKISSSVTYTLLSSLVLIIGGFAVIGFVLECRLGVGEYDTAFSLLQFIPPLGTFVGRATYLFDSMSDFDFDYWNYFKFLTPAAIIIYLITAAALVALSYFIFKHRKPENTGHSIAVKHFYHVFAGMVAVSLICLCCYPMYGLHIWWLSILVAAVVGAVALTIFTVANKADRPHVKKNLIRNASIVAGCIALLFVFDKTAAFGTRYYNHSAAKTKSITINLYNYSVGDRIHENFVIDNKEDIEQFIAATNKTLKNRADELERGYMFSVYYKLENGREIARKYNIRYNYQYGEHPNAIEEMFENVYDLPNYPKYSSETAYRVLNNDAENNVYAVTIDKFGKVNIPKERIKEFSEILTREMLEKFDKNVKRVGRVITSRYEDGAGFRSEYPILECYTDTLSFVESLREYDGEENAFHISVYGNINVDLTVKINDTESGAEKELFSLFEPMTNDYYNGVNSGGISFNIEASNEIRYYIPEENKERAFDLILTIIEKQFKQKFS